MITSHQDVGGLGLWLFEMEQVAEALNLTTSLMNYPNPSSPLLIESLELL